MAHGKAKGELFNLINKKNLYLNIKNKWILPEVDGNPVIVKFTKNCKKSEMLNLMVHTTKSEFGQTNQGSIKLLLRESTRTNYRTTDLFFSF